jgi:hypothetical protein
MALKHQIASLLFFILSFGVSTCLLAANSGPFPVKGQIFDKNNQPAGTAHVYPRFVEIYNLENRKMGRVGILVEKGIAKLFLAGESQKQILVGYAEKGQMRNRNDKIVGSYFVTPTWSFVHDAKGNRAGKVKCIAWPRVCAAGVGGYLLNLFGETDESTP